MDRLALAALVALAAGGSALAAAQKKSGTHVAPAMHLVSYDRQNREAVVELRGFSRVPGANFFTFTDDRDRHFVAPSVRCEDKDGARACRLAIPAGYEKHPLVSLGVHLHGLHGRVVAVPADEIAHAQEANAPAASDVEKGEANVDGGA